LLTQLSARPGLPEIASEIARVQKRLAGSLLVSADLLTAGATGGAAASTFPAALRIRQDAAIVLLPRSVHDALPGGANLLAMDRATGLTIMHTEGTDPVLVPAPWTPETLDVPRYFMATVIALDHVALQPVFITAMKPDRSPAWSGPVWMLPPAADIAAGSMLFTPNGEIVGVVTRHRGAPAVVPGDTLLADAQRLLDRGRIVPGQIGMAAQDLTAPLAAATGAAAGIIVTWVDPDGPARDVGVGDVVESINGASIGSLEEWDVRSRRLSAGESVTLDLRRRGAARRVQFVAVPVGEHGAARALGLVARYVSGLGSEVLDIDRGSAAEAAGLRIGDVITSIESSRRPSPARIAQVYAAADEGYAMLVGITRNRTPQVLALVK
jgi:hypothetical protein